MSVVRGAAGLTELSGTLACQLGSELTALQACATAVLCLPWSAC